MRVILPVGQSRSRDTLYGTHDGSSLGRDGNKRQLVEMPDDAPVSRLLIVLLEKMKFPQYAPDGQPLSYKFHHRATGKQLLDGNRWPTSA